MSSLMNHLFFPWFKAEHFARIQQALRIVAPLGCELNVVFAIASAVLNIVYVGIGHKHANRSTVPDHLVEAFFRREVHKGERTWNDASRGVLPELHVEENFGAVFFL